MYDKMAEEEISHLDKLFDLHRKNFGELPVQHTGRQFT
jgi:hypothetical protein